jgi:hypothetical protein
MAAEAEKKVRPLLLERRIQINRRLKNQLRNV